MLVSNSKGLVEDSRMIGSDIVRSAENIRQHYIIERELADRLRHASREERRAGLYAAVYNELFRRVPDHPLIEIYAGADLSRVCWATTLSLLVGSEQSISYSITPP